MKLNLSQVPLSQEIKQEYDRLKNLVASLSPSSRTLKTIEGTRGLISVNDLIAYQIGWGKSLIRWYEAGIKGETPLMPGDGFSICDYTAIAKHFYQKYQYDTIEMQDEVFHRIVLKLLDIVEIEHQRGHLEKLGAWPWCTLSSGKEWPLSKWIKVNSSSPYKRAYLLIKKQKKTYETKNRP